MYLDHEWINLFGVSYGGWLAELLPTCMDANLVALFAVIAHYDASHPEGRDVNAFRCFSLNKSDYFEVKYLP